VASLIVLVLFGCVTGLTTVLFGFGGGFITVPVVYAVLFGSVRGDAMHVAVATSTAVMIVNATVATIGQARAGRLRRDYLWPLVAFIGLGAVLGALAGLETSDLILRILFAAYLALTILDSLLRRGFLGTEGVEQPSPLSRATSTLGGVGVGAVASFLGVGGSVMTVPLLRRRGLPMADAVALANPLTIPVAVVGTLVYAFSASATSMPGGTWHAGFVDLAAGLALLAGSLPTIALVRRLTVRIPDRAHAVAYVGLLGAALATTVFV
jgi:uncharacterized membrane protein YfcA